jgi:hypothetical protein
MQKYLFCLITIVLVSSISFSQMKLNVPSDIETEEKMSNLKLVLNKTETSADATNFFPGTIMLGLLGDVTFPFGEEFKNYAGTGWSIHAFGGYSILNSLVLALKAGYIRFGDVETDYGFLGKNSQITEGSIQYNTQVIIALMIQYLMGGGSCIGPLAGGVIKPFIALAICLIFKNYVYQLLNVQSIYKIANTVQTDEKFEESSTIFGISPSVGTYFNISENVSLILSADYYYLFDEADIGAANINYLSLTFGGAYSFR